MIQLTFDRNIQAAIKKEAYNHIMSLSRDFHTEKRSGELFRSISQGSSITDLLDVAFVRIVPVCIDLIVAVFYLYADTPLSQC